MRHRSWTTVAVIVTAGGWSLKFAPNATATTPMTSAPNSAAARPAISATTDVHGGHAGLPAHLDARRDLGGLVEVG